ncbi:MAG: light-regulated signal transduction histidine kinase (bacteriophytochrome) [Loktanella salsilacus]|jgi:light-regulated signal transduction histidine kinase (bacteriophytochrome)
MTLHRKLCVANVIGSVVHCVRAHGLEVVPIKVSDTVANDDFVLSVANGVARIPYARLSNLIMPLERGGVRPSREGLDLGLFIGSKIAVRDGGTSMVVERRRNYLYVSDAKYQLTVLQLDTSQGA